jgi:DNA-binding response OmpR family regulator
VKSFLKNPELPTRLLIVDPDAPLRAMLNLVFTAAGYRVLQADNGDDALAIHRRQAVDVVVSELVLPGKDGYETLRELGALPARPKFIAVARDGRTTATQHLQMASSLGADRVLAKPFHPETLLALVGEVVAE